MRRSSRIFSATGHDGQMHQRSPVMQWVLRSMKQFSGSCSPAARGVYVGQSTQTHSCRSRSRFSLLARRVGPDSAISVTLSILPAAARRAETWPVRSCRTARPTSYSTFLTVGGGVVPCAGEGIHPLAGQVTANLARQ